LKKTDAVALSPSSILQCGPRHEIFPFSGPRSENVRHLWLIIPSSVYSIVVCLQGRFCKAKFTVLHRHPSRRAFPVFPNRSVVIQDGVPTSQGV